MVLSSVGSAASIKAGCAGVSANGDPPYTCTGFRDDDAINYNLAITNDPNFAWANPNGPEGSCSSPGDPCSTTTSDASTRFGNGTSIHVFMGDSHCNNIFNCNAQNGCLLRTSSQCKIDSSENKCVQCSGKFEDNICADSGGGQLNNPSGCTNALTTVSCSKSGSGCESACGASAQCDDKAQGASCTSSSGEPGTCNGSCDCVPLPDCTDTDPPGNPYTYNNYTTKGTCTNSSGTSFTDYCPNGDNTDLLEELFCCDNQTDCCVFTNSVSCSAQFGASYVCEQGKCVNKPCSDNDPPGSGFTYNNYTTAGTCAPTPTFGGNVSDNCPNGNGTDNLAEIFCCNNNAQCCVFVGGISCSGQFGQGYACKDGACKLCGGLPNGTACGTRNCTGCGSDPNCAWVGSCTKTCQNESCQDCTPVCSNQNCCADNDNSCGNCGNCQNCNNSDNWYNVGG
ncbi:MAG TPA: hypothetical protein VJA40_01100, partial [archaeon]|nr:hypothetical protein [archaeon]